MMKEKNLYQKAKTGKIHFWKAWTEGTEVVITHGTLNGKPVINRYTAESTNLGKKNERLPEEQAIFEVESLYKKKLDKKYCTSVKEAGKSKFLPMTAQSGEVVSKRDKITYPAYVQRKYNGVRCMANWRPEGGIIRKVFLMSRGNKQYHVNHIEDQLSHSRLNINDAFDGELYTHGMRLQEINSLVKKWRPEESEAINYIIYDYPYVKGESLPQKERIERLLELQANFKNKSNIFIADVFEVNSWKEARKYEKKFVKEGYEGAILRTFGGEYEFGNRSDSLIKVKSYTDAEFEVIGYDVEKSNINGKKIDAVLWVCKNNIKSPDGTYKTFEVRPVGTLREREKLLKIADEYLGKKLTVKFYERTADNLPFHCSGLLFRLKEDLPDES